MPYDLHYSCWYSITEINVENNIEKQFNILKT